MLGGDGEEGKKKTTRPHAGTPTTPTTPTTPATPAAPSKDAAQGPARIRSTPFSRLTRPSKP